MSTAYYIAAGLIITAGLYTARRYRQSPAPALGVFAVTLFLLAGAFVILANGSRPIIDQLVGVEPLARWMGNSLTIAAAASLNIVLGHFARRRTDPPPRVRRYVLAVTIASAAMAALILGTVHDNDDFVDVYATNGRITAYLLIYLAAIGVAMANAMISGTRYAIRTRTWMRAAMTLVATGGTFGVAYSLYKGAVVIAHYNGERIGTESIIGPSLGLVAALLITIGSTLGTWGPVVSTAMHHTALYRRLEPLHAALTTAFPEILLGVDIPDRRYRLNRRVVEIRDGQFRLRPWSDRAQASALANGLHHQHDPATVQAMIIAAALHAHAAGAAPADPYPTQQLNEPTHAVSLEDEAANLAHIATSFAALPAHAQLPEVTPAQ